MEEYELVVFEGGRSLFARIVAATLFTILLYDLFLIATAAIHNDDIIVTGITEFCRNAKLIGFCTAGGVCYSVERAVLIDIDKNKLISRYSIGPFSHDIITDVPSLEYVSVFLNGKEQYEVNLWYKPNRHYNMYVFEEERPALDFAKMVCEKLRIDLLDATEKGNFTWRDRA